MGRKQEVELVIGQLNNNPPQMAHTLSVKDSTHYWPRVSLLYVYSVGLWHLTI